ncbi:MAG TPA: MBOAT family protein [Acidimicrobiales bacterium]|nr:MBOAT family protein [Acidimicrobiales bacterium]
MLFPTVAFAVFFLAAFTANWLLRPHFLVWRATLIAFSLYFYGWVDVRFVLVIVGSASVNWALALAIRRAMLDGRRSDGSRRLVRLAVAANLVLLGVFKYHGFFVASTADALASIGLHPTTPVLSILLPVGISFFTFHAISYVVDVGRGDIEPIGYADLLLYMSFFPHLVAGPIVRVDELVPQFHQRPDPRRVAFTEGVTLIAVGLVKKVVVAGYLGSQIVDPAYGTPGLRSGGELLAATYAYAVQIYADFSGYTDIAIGCALLLGFRLPENFASPYRSLSVREFWHRWHMTLSRWLRDYVYIPLGGNRDGTRATYRNLMATMLLGGLWHGADWRFVLWGGLHGTYLVGERAASAWWGGRDVRPAVPPAVSVVLRWLLTFNLVCAAWIFFRADSISTAFTILGRIVTAAAGSTTLVTGLVVATVVAALVSQLIPDHRTGALRVRFSRLEWGAQAALLAVGLTAIAVLGPDGVAPFIYFRF